MLINYSLMYLFIYCTFCLFADLCGIVSVYIFLCSYFVLFVLISVTTFRIVTWEMNIVNLKFASPCLIIQFK
jgi:hypothetical protein